MIVQRLQLIRLDFESMLLDYNSLPHWRETWGSFERWKVSLIWNWWMVCPWNRRRYSSEQIFPLTVKLVLFTRHQFYWNGRLPHQHPKHLYILCIVGSINKCIFTYNIKFNADENRIHSYFNNFCVDTYSLFPKWA